MNRLMVNIGQYVRTCNKHPVSNAISASEVGAARTESDRIPTSLSYGTWNRQFNSSRNKNLLKTQHRSDRFIFGVRRFVGTFILSTNKSFRSIQS